MTICLTSNSRWYKNQYALEASLNKTIFLFGCFSPRLHNLLQTVLCQRPCCIPIPFLVHHVFPLSLCPAKVVLARFNEQEIWQSHSNSLYSHIIVLPRRETRPLAPSSDCPPQSHFPVTELTSPCHNLTMSSTRVRRWQNVSFLTYRFDLIGSHTPNLLHRKPTFLRFGHRIRFLGVCVCVGGGRRQYSFHTWTTSIFNPASESELFMFETNRGCQSSKA